MSATNDSVAAAQAQPQGPQLNILKVYVKDLSFEAPGTPGIFNEVTQQQTTVDTQIGNSASTVGPNLHEVVLAITITVRMGERSVYVAEVKQAGVFAIQGVEDAQMPMVLAAVCPSILFPFARESVCDVVVRGGFPQLLLPPVNFEALYQQQLAQRQVTANGETLQA
ncbi:MAG TPA: protein-export chaperone SecB [Gammaproteobacteria bacterium]|nr:protein-export chaperone SecB [Gammaproteobacteria bacterium]